MWKRLCLLASVAMSVFAVMFLPDTAWAATTWTATASSSYGAPGQYPAQNANDGNLSTDWLSGGNPNTAPEWLALATASPVYVTSYSLASKSQPGYGPTAWKLQGSTDGTTWTDLDSRTAPSSTWNPGTLVSYPITTPGTFPRYRLLVTATPNTFTWVSEVVLTEGAAPTGTPTPTTSPSSTATVPAPGPSSSSSSPAPSSTAPATTSPPPASSTGSVCGTSPDTPCYVAPSSDWAGPLMIGSGVMLLCGCALVVMKMGG